MEKKINIELINDIFAIPRDGSNIVDDDDDDLGLAKSESSVSFAVKASEIAEDLNKMPKENNNTETVKPSVDDAVKNIKTSFGDIFDKLDEKCEPSITSLPAKQTELTSPVEETVVVDDRVDTKQTIDAIPSASDVSIKLGKIGGGKRRWKLTSPSIKFQRFYEDKVVILSNDLLKDGEIPFDSYYQELANANINNDVTTFDTEEVGRRITEVMKWRDRIKFIQLHVNKQYFIWRQYMDLLPGVLARIEYERGKQEGITYEHMSDMNSYLGDLEGIFKSCEMVSKHLDAAYASLSRQVAIAQPLNEIERYNTSGIRPLTPKLQKYDSLETNETGSDDVVGTKKDVAKATEPKQKTSVWERM